MWLTGKSIRRHHNRSSSADGAAIIADNVVGTTTSTAMHAISGRALLMKLWKNEAPSGNERARRRCGDAGLTAAASRAGPARRR